MMDDPFSLLLLVVVVPVFYVAVRVAPRSPAVAATLGLGLVGAIVMNAPREGIGLDGVKRFNFLVIGATAGVLWGRHWGIPWLESRRNRIFALLPVALFACLGYTNFLAFHGGGHVAHLHDIAHYYLGSKYFDELRYGNLYVAMVRAEAEVFGHSLTDQARDLEGNYLVPIGQLLDQSEPVKARFSAERWNEFRGDVVAFRDRMGARFGELLQDHGYNPTPVWALLGGFVANRIPVTGGLGIEVLAFLDWPIVAFSFAVCGFVFGVEAMLLALVYFATAFGCELAWHGGGFLREVTFSGILLAAAALERARFLLAGLLLGLVSALRVFPALLAAGLAGQAITTFRSERRFPRPHLRFAIAALTTGLGLFVATTIAGGGLEPWRSFHDKIGSHMDSASANRIGLTAVAAYVTNPGAATVGELNGQLQDVESLQRLVLLPLAGLAVLGLAGSVTPAQSLVLSSGLLLAALNLSAYYYGFLAIVPLVFRDQPREVALLFTVELLIGAARLYEQHEVVLYLAKSFLLALFWVAVFLLPGPETSRNRTQIDSRGDAQLA